MDGNGESVIKSSGIDTKRITCMNIDDNQSARKQYGKAFAKDLFSI